VDFGAKNDQFGRFSSGNERTTQVCAGLPRYSLDVPCLYTTNPNHCNDSGGWRPELFAVWMEYARVLGAEGRKKEASAIEARVQGD
jgi:hypothetical protein